MPSPVRDIRAGVATAMNLRRAVELDELKVHYQPLVHLPSRSIVGFEALLRWQHPRHGLIPPNQFIPAAEETGLIVPVGEWVLREACRQLKIWRTKFPQHPPLSMNVNLSVRQLADPRLVPKIARIIDETGIPPETLALELTEGSLASELESAREVLANLHALRVRLKLDDFGTGYSSLSYLGTLRFDALKIDRSFVQRLIANPATDAIVETVIQLARKLDMAVIAEGIENEEQLTRLMDLGCDTGQGFLFSRPVNASAAERMLASAIPMPDLHALGGILEACGYPRRQPGAEMRRRLSQAASASPGLPGQPLLTT